LVYCVDSTYVTVWSLANANFPKLIGIFYIAVNTLVFIGQTTGPHQYNLDQLVLHNLIRHLSLLKSLDNETFPAMISNQICLRLRFIFTF
jgi:hypothetical protein